MRKPEASFENDLTRLAPFFGCEYEKIPDTKMINRYNRDMNREKKRPFDGVLVTPNGNFCIEAKVNSNKLMIHQEIIQDEINKVNKSYFVLRKRIGKRRINYQVEQDHNLIFETTEIENLFKFFKELEK